MYLLTHPDGCTTTFVNDINKICRRKSSTDNPLLLFHENRIFLVLHEIRGNE